MSNLEPHEQATGSTILLVEDEPVIRMLITEFLEEQGHVVIEAADAAAGLALLRTSTRIDLLITDIGLPGDMDGRQLADAARACRPDLKMLFITGQAEPDGTGDARSSPMTQLLSKPFTMSTLEVKLAILAGQ